MDIGICDDQKEIRELIADKVMKVYPAANIIFYSSGQEVLEALQFPDILFLDIKMPGTDGMETARKLRKFNRNIIIIFVTVTEEYVFQSFDVGAFHYLVKPFNNEKFAEVLQNAARQYNENIRAWHDIKKETPGFIVSSKGVHITINPEDIVYAEVFNRKVIIHTMDSDIEYYGRMKELAEKAGDRFYRTHRAYLVNFDFICKYDSANVYLKKGKALMSKQNYHDFVKSYLRYNQRKENK